MGGNARVGEVAKHAWGTLGERLLFRWFRSKQLKSSLQSNRKYWLHSLPQTGSERAKDAFNFFRLRGEFNPKRYYKKSSEVVRGKGKGEWKAKIQEYTRGKNQKSQPFDNILFHNVHSPMFQLHE